MIGNVANSPSRLPPLSYEKNSDKTLNEYQFDANTTHLNGPSYTLSDVKYSLPNPSALKPFVDIKPGEVDTWPAHASGQTYGSMVLVQSASAAAPLSNPWDKKVIPKPKFLSQLEAFVQKEMRVLNCPPKGPSDLRLQVYREVFEYLMNDFKTYKPLLAAIKNEYELVISSLRDHIRQLEPLKSTLVTLSDQCDLRIAKIKENERQDLKNMKQENLRLLQKIDTMTEEKLDYEAQIEHLKNEVAAEYERYKHESDQRRMMLSDLNELRYQNTSSPPPPGQQQSETLEASTKEDPIILRIALRKTRDANEELTARLNRMIADYNDVVPRRDFESLQKEYEEYKESVKFLEGDSVRIQKEMEALNSTYKQVTEQRDSFYVELEKMKRTSTPRPQWDTCTNYISGGKKRWTELTEEQSSDHKMKVLLSELTGATVDSFHVKDEIECLGITPEVPKYLKAEGTIKNKKLNKPETLSIIQDLWKRKSQVDTKSPEKEQVVADYFYTYLAERFGMSKVCEWAYNLLDACERFKFDYRLGLFKDTLDGNVDEKIFSQYHFMNILLKKTIGEVVGDQKDLNQNELKIALLKIMPSKSDGELAEIQKALFATPTTKLTIDEVFQEDETDCQTALVSVLHSQQEKLRSFIVERVKNWLANKTEISSQQLKDALAGSVSTLDSASIDYAIRWCFKVSNSSEAGHSLSLEDVSERLQNCAIPRLISS